jgi:hypothetical protein
MKDVGGRCKIVQNKVTGCRKTSGGAGDRAGKGGNRARCLSDGIIPGTIGSFLRGMIITLGLFDDPEERKITLFGGSF